MKTSKTRGGEISCEKNTITADELTAQTDFAGSFSDSFRIMKPGALVALRLFVEDNPLLVSLLVAPIVLGVAVVSLNRWKGWPPLSRRSRQCHSVASSQSLA